MASNQQDLIRQAQKGDINALQTHLAQLLRRKNIPVNVKATLPNYCLILRLLPIAEADINLSHIAKILEREMSQLAIPLINQVRVQYKSYEEKFPLTPPAKTKHIAKYWGLDVEGWRSLGIGLLLALIIFNVPILTTAFHGFPLAVHEVGHAVTHWLFGRPAIPTIDFAFGGGIAIVFPQSVPILILIYLALASLAYLVRQHLKLLVTLCLITAIYTYCLMTPTNDMLSVGMGHGLELVAIFICFYFCLGKYFCPFAGERTIYAMLGFFTVFHDCRFAWKIVRDSDWRAMYLMGKGGLLDHDLVILAKQYFNTDYSVMANWFLACCIIAPILAVIFFALEYKWQNWLSSLWE